MSTPETPGPDRRRPHPAPDPLGMTPGEKVMAEWEARHDVIARGGRAVPGAVQHYLSESHSRDACDRAASPPPAHPARAARPARHADERPTPWWLRPAR
jgi:hypothetical protein